MRQILYTLAFLCALLPQCLVAILAPALVLCQEANGGQVLEFALSDCCDVTGEAQTEEPGAHPLEDCAGCSDSAVPTSLTRDEAQQPVLVVKVFPHESPAWRWDASPPRQRLGLPEPIPNPALRALRSVKIRC